MNLVLLVGNFTNLEKITQVTNFRLYCRNLLLINIDFIYTYILEKIHHFLKIVDKLLTPRKQPLKIRWQMVPEINYTFQCIIFETVHFYSDRMLGWKWAEM